MQARLLTGFICLAYDYSGDGARLRSAGLVCGAGVIRSLVWDYLHGYQESTPGADIPPKCYW